MTRKLLVVAALLAVTGCNHGAGRAAVSMTLDSAQRGAADASVYIDEEYVGPLGYVAVRGVRLPVGEHRITVEKEGYFPWDHLVVSDRQPIKLDVRLVPIPD